MTKLPNEDRKALWVTPDRRKVIGIIAAIEGRELRDIADEMADLYIATKQVPAAELGKLLQPADSGA